jgi:hypothetical protein
MVKVFNGIQLNFGKSFKNVKFKCDHEMNYLEEKKCLYNEKSMCLQKTN